MTTQSLITHDRANFRHIKEELDYLARLYGEAIDRELDYRASLRPQALAPDLIAGRRRMACEAWNRWEEAQQAYCLERRRVLQDE